MEISTIWANILDKLTYDPTSPMIFSSGTFWALFLLFLPLYGLFKKKGGRMDMVKQMCIHFVYVCTAPVN